MALAVSLTYIKIVRHRLAKFSFRGSRDSMSNMIAIVLTSLLEASFFRTLAKNSNSKLDSNSLGHALRSK